MFNVSRDSLLLYLGAAAALVAYLMTTEKSPMEWNYRDWLNALTVAIAWGIGKLQTSPLPSHETVVRRRAALKGHENRK